MGRRLSKIVGVVGVLALVAGAAGAVGRAAFERRITGEVAALFAASRAEPGAMVTEQDLTSLPEPVQRWLRWARVVGKERPRAVHLTMEGQFRLGEDRGWMPFTAVEYYTTNPPGFVWPVTMQMAPLLPIVGRDRFAAGVGSIEMRVLGLVPVADASGGGLNQGALLRYLNETVWFPAAVLDPAISWEEVAADAARATMHYGGVTVSAVFFFDAQGRPVNMVAARYNDSRDRIESWSTPFSAYGEFGGVRVPTAGEGVWRYDTGDFTYIRLRVTAIETGRPEAFAA